MLQTIAFGRPFWLPLVTGVAWMLCGEAAGLLGLVLAVPPAFLLMVAAYFGLQPAEVKRSAGLSALGGGVGVLFGVLSLLFFGFFEGALLLGLSGWTFVDAGARGAASLEPVEGIPAPESSLGFHTAVALDEALLGAMAFMIPLPRKSEVARISAEVDEAIERFEACGWLEKPEEYHRAPLPLELPRLRNASTRTHRGRIEFEEMSFESEYEPAIGEPGRERWLGYLANRTASAHVMRHPGAPRPWLVCIHGYQMGRALEDLGAFDAPFLHNKLGFNLVFPTLPLHGSRKIGRLSGDGFLSGDVLDSIHAETQGLWDIRRILSWVRAQEAPSIGVYGLSLGGYTTSMLAGIEDGLDFAIAGIPMTNLSDSYWNHLPDLVAREYLACGVTREKLDVVTRVVTPTLLAPRVPHERRAIFGGVGDRLVPAQQVADLERHWGSPATAWYQGSHITFMREANVRRLISDTARSVTAGPTPAGELG